MPIANYIHDLDPVLIELFGSLKLRWYGLAYLAGFVAGYYLLRYLADRKLWVLPAEKAGDFVTYAAFFGVFLGGRIGYMLFYYTTTNGPSWMWQDPLLLLKVWDGGMASHGAILGLVLFTLFYSKRQNVNWFGLGDGLCVVAPIGIFFGRIANFINGEIYGQSSTVAWAVKFPKTLLYDQPEASRYNEAMAAAIEVDPSLINSEGQLVPFNQILAHSRENPQLLETLGRYLEPRHPAQLYEAIAEGLILFTALIVVRLRYPKLPHGVLTGLFFIIYAVGRIICENYRLSSTKDILGIQMGQFLSLFMIAMGITFILVGNKFKQPNS